MNTAEDRRTANTNKVPMAASPLVINGMAMPNRTFFAPMTRRAADPATRCPTEAVRDYYTRRAAGGFGLIITEGVFVNNHNAMNKEMCPLCRTDEQVAAWKAVVDSCKAANPHVKMCIQLWHVGVWSIKPIGPSQSPVPAGFNIKAADPNAALSAAIAKGATDADLEGIINDFTITAVNAVTKAGFDCVEIHGAHGYLVDIFSDLFYNRRKLKDGQSFSSESTGARAGFGAALTESLRAALGPKVPILMRFSQWEVQDLKCIKYSTSAELREFLYALQDAGVDAFDVSTRMWNSPAFPSEDGTMGLAAWCKKLLLERTGSASDGGAASIPAVLAVGGLTISRQFLDAAEATAPADNSYALTDPTPALDAIEAGIFDGIGVGRCALTNPDWPSKVLTGKWKELRAFSDTDKEYGRVDM